MSPAVTNQARLDVSWARARHRPGELMSVWHALDVIILINYVHGRGDGRSSGSSSGRRQNVFGT